MESGGHGSPGAGSAGAIALALAAACGSKAITISLARGTPDPELESARADLSALARAALGAAMGDATAFAAYLEERSREALQRLIDEEARLRHLTAHMLAVVGRLEQRISPVMKGDWLAARELARAASAIAGENLTETAKAAGR